MASEIFVDFEWPVATGYVIEVGQKVPIANSGGLAATILTGEVDTPDCIRAVGPWRTKQRPLEHAPKLYLEFKSLPPTAEAIGRFASKWGQLEGQDIDYAEPISFWIKKITEMVGFLDTVRLLQGERDQAPQLFRIYESLGYPVSNIGAVLAPRISDGQMALILRPHNLGDALFLQAAQAIASGRKIRACEECETWYEAGSGASRRDDAKFCSDRCRNRRNNRLKLRSV